MLSQTHNPIPIQSNPQMETLERSPLSSPPIPHSSILDSKISPSILLIIVIVAVIFFLSGLLQLLVRFLLRPSNRDPSTSNDVTALQGQLQQLFYLHDAGVDQSFIDTLPLFNYSAIIGVKDPFDCAVCLCEFDSDDRLRLLPKCSHAFHTHCIDTWLLSHSTCPICRSNLLDGVSISHRSAQLPLVCVLEAGADAELGESETESETPNLGSGRIVTVKLGKFGNGSGESSASVVSSRRCYSMGSFAYIMDESSSFRVPIRSPEKKENVVKGGSFSRYGGSKGESFSMSRIWDREKGSGSNGGKSEIENVCGDEETQSCYSVESSGTGGAKRTLLWLMGRHQNKVVSSFVGSLDV